MQTQRTEKLLNILKALTSSQAKYWGINYYTLQNIKKGKIPRRDFIEKWLKKLQIK